jgi:Endoribonuclease GhoS
MANYIARVELHKATYDNYEQLHASMAARGYQRTIVGDNGKTYQLPTGTYAVENTDASMDTALNAAKEAADDTGKSSSVIVANWTQTMWIGLSIV